MRLIIVSNRLPMTVVEREGKLTFKRSVGGLVSGLSAYLDSIKSSAFTKSDYVWVGWPGITVGDNLKKPLREEAFSKYQAYPVFLSEKDMDSFYHGFCNKTIWPLYHYFLHQTIFNEAYWKTYVRVNKIFAEALVEIARPDDVIWVHDYHLMLLPKILKEKKLENPVGFFLHIPFPAYEIFRLLPRKWAHGIIEGLMGSNVIGFHTHDYTRYFLRSALRYLGYKHNMGEVIAGDHLVKVDTYPMGIDYKKFSKAATSQVVLKEKDKLKKTLEDYKVIVSVDRLDYTKGVLNRLQGYHEFLEKYPEWHKKVIMVMVVVPSRIGVEHYQEMKRQIDELVGRINGKFGSIDWTPAIYQNRFFSLNQLVALYASSDVALITPLRDGMNLIAKEYIASRPDKTGVLILSERAGAAKEMTEAILVNPNNREEMAEALKEALEMPRETQMELNDVMHKRLSHHDVVHWADQFINDLVTIQEKQRGMHARQLRGKVREDLLRHYAKAKRRMLFFDYDGTLSQFVVDPQQARPSERTLKALKTLVQDKRNEVVLISGRDRQTLQKWFKGVKLGIVAEHGSLIMEPDGSWRLVKEITQDWKPEIMPSLRRYAERLPGSHIEEKQFSVVWHYRNADPEAASDISKECIDDLVSFTANMDVEVLQGNKVIELRSTGINKGTAGLSFVAKGTHDFILSIGDDWTDEDLFRVLPESSYSVRVGLAQTYARFYVKGVEDVHHLLDELTKL